MFSNKISQKPSNYKSDLNDYSKLDPALQKQLMEFEMDGIDSQREDVIIDDNKRQNDNGDSISISKSKQSQSSKAITF